MFKKENIPNLLCYIRIAGAPAVIILMIFAAVFEGSRSILIIASGIVFGLAMITDLFDGMFARKYDVVSDTGKILDPNADKILIIGTMISFCIYDFICGDYGFIYIIPITVIIIREIIVVSLRLITAKKGVVIGASIFGKVKTFTQSVAIGLSFFMFLFRINTAALVFISIAGLVTLFSLFPYISMYTKELRKLNSH